MNRNVYPKQDILAFPERTTSWSIPHPSLLQLPNKTESEEQHKRGELYRLGRHDGDASFPKVVLCTQVRLLLCQLLHDTQGQKDFVTNYKGYFNALHFYSSKLFLERLMVLKITSDFQLLPSLKKNHFHLYFCH